MPNYLRRKEEAEAALKSESWGSLLWLADKKTSGFEITLGKVVILKGKSNTPHIHSNAGEVLHLLSGNLRHFIGDEAIEIGPGDTLFIPRGLKHYAESIGGEDAVMIVSYDSGARGYLQVP